jgi:hypothetical protein
LLGAFSQAKPNPGGADGFAAQNGKDCQANPAASWFALMKIPFIKGN